MGTKIDGDRCYDAAMPDEPMFVLLARDESSPKLVRQWAAIRQSLISAGLKPESDQAQIDEALALADRMEVWRREADEARRKQAAFDFAEGTADAFRDAVLHGTGAVLDGEHVPVRDLMHEHGNVERQQDEIFCPRCAKRWGVDEPAPGCRDLRREAMDRAGEV